MIKKRYYFYLLLVASIVYVLRPADIGLPHNPYFEDLNRELQARGPGVPALILDLDRIDANLDLVLATIGDPDQLRIVAKSLPSLPLLKHLMARSGSNKLMVFHAPFIPHYASAFTTADLLVGKPLPVRAVENMFTGLSATESTEVAGQTQWLVDSQQRLYQYLAFAARSGLRFRINIEIDVGLHRGGIRQAKDLVPLLEVIRNNPQHLVFAGLMGYDAHLSAVPALGSKVEAMQEAAADLIEEYDRFKHVLQDGFADLILANVTYNGAGSKTYMLYMHQPVLNDIALGSGLVKPSDYEFVTLKEHQPALFIATPVLKKEEGGRIPFIEFLAPFWRWWNPNRALSWFIYSGSWRAEYTSPAGLSDNPLYGSSTNQHMVNGSRNTGLEVDDLVFLRPRQSEKTMLEFGDLVVLKQGKIVDHWPVLQP